MIKKEKILQEKTISRKYCDVCGKKVKMGLACDNKRCEICGKDLCEDCVYHEEYNSGDYREVYCKVCWEIGEKYRQNIELLEEKIEKLYNEWHDKCIS